MSVSYKLVQWNRQKKVYDRVMLGLIALFLITFVLLQLIFFPNISPETLIIRATGLLAFLLLHVILSIGPLARLNRYLLPYVADQVRVCGALKLQDDWLVLYTNPEGDILRIEPFWAGEDIPMCKGG